MIAMQRRIKMMQRCRFQAAAEAAPGAGTPRRRFAPAALVAAALLLGGRAGAHAADAIVEWDSNTEPDIAGYKVHYGPSGGSTTVVDVGPASTFLLSGLEDGRAYRLAVSAYDSFGQESPLSDEVVFAPIFVDSDGDGLSDSLEGRGCTSAVDADSDDDGFADGAEDADRNGRLDPGETNPCLADTDADGLQDGTESGLTLAAIGAGTDVAIFIPDADPATQTDPLNPDTDGDGLLDGAEDADHNGRLDAGETDPLSNDNPRLFADTFADGTAAGDPDWTRATGKWTVDGSKRFVSASDRDSRALVADPALEQFVAGRVETWVQLTRRYRRGPNAEIVFHYQDGSHYRYLRITGREILIGQVGTIGTEPGGIKARAPRRFAFGSWYGLRLDIASDGRCNAYLGGQTEPVLAAQFAEPSSGKLGYQTRRAKSLFDNAAVWNESVLP